MNSINSAVETAQSSSKFSYKDFTWCLSLFGTAVGAGVLFLPIKAGAGGFWPLVILALIAAPMTWFAHKSLARFVLSAKNPEADITDTVEEHFGKTGANLITFAYFLLFTQSYLSTVLVLQTRLIHSWLTKWAWSQFLVGYCLVHLSLL